jgi:PPP family 3-phenylpropionic acid transporter
MAIIALASAAIVLRLLVYALVPTKLGVVAGQLLHSICYGLFLPCAVAFINLKTPPAHRTTGMALFFGFGMGLPAVLGSALGGIVVEDLGYRWLFASFSLFALASLVLYGKNRKALDSIR